MDWCLLPVHKCNLHVRDSVGGGQPDGMFGREGRWFESSYRRPSRNLMYTSFLLIKEIKDKVITFNSVFTILRRAECCGLSKDHVGHDDRRIGYKNLLSLFIQNSIMHCPWPR